MQKPESYDNFSTGRTTIKRGSSDSNPSNGIKNKMPFVSYWLFAELIGFSTVNGIGETSHLLAYGK